MAKNKIALVTGGNRGLGRDMALQLARKGLDVILTYYSKKEEAFQVVKEIQQMGGNATALQLDVSELKGFDHFFNQLVRELKETFVSEHFDYLINNAGIGLNISFMETTEEQFDQLLNVQYKGVFFFTQKAVNLIKDGGGIVNISSRLAQASMPGYAAYAAMKGAVETLTRYLAKELSPRGIKVNAVAPGPIATDFVGGVIRDNVQYNAKVKELTALGRVGEPEDIGGVVAFLCSEDARWITAQRIEVSGGMSI